MNDHAARTTDDVIEQLAEHRLDWELIKHRIETAMDDRGGSAAAARHVGPYLTISRQAGTGGGVIARRLGEALGWAVLDGEIVDLIADLFHLDPTMLHVLDEAKASWVRDVLSDIMPLEVVDRDTYVHHLGRVLHLAAVHGRVVLVGRGASLFLPRGQGLAVRLVGDEAQRLERLAARDGLDHRTAAKRLAEVDRQRARLVEHYFARRVEDPLLYDLVLNTSTLSADDVVATVTAACRQRGLDR